MYIFKNEVLALGLSTQVFNVDTCFLSSSWKGHLSEGYGQLCSIYLKLLRTKMEYHTKVSPCRPLRAPPPPPRLLSTSVA